MKRLLGIGLTLILFIGPLFAQEPASVSSDDLVQVVNEVVRLFQKYGLPFDARKTRDAAVDAMIRAADPGGRLMSEADVARMKAQNKGMIHEIGIRVAWTNGAFTIREVKKDSDAERAGLKAGNIVQEIDKGNITGLKPTEVDELLRGPADQTVTLKIQDAHSTSRVVEVKRESFEAGPILVAEELPANLGYLKLNGIFERSGKDIVSTMRGWAETGRAGVVLDLRGAAGMDAQSAADTASLFAESGALLFTFRDSRDQTLGAYKSNSSLPLNMPAMILIDEKTRGASELLAAALAGSTRGAMLIGSVSSGDPLVREVIKLSDGEYLYLASKRLVVADGTVYTGREGVKPNLVVAPAASPAADYEPEPVVDGKKEWSEEEKEDKRLRERVRGDETLRRAVDILLGLKALNVRGVERVENLRH
jgi:carboxyl-terminal processing protease